MSKRGTGRLKSTQKRDKKSIIDTSKYKKTHEQILGFVKKQAGLDLNKYRDGDGSSSSMTTYWDKNGPKVAIDFKRMDNVDKRKLLGLTNLPYGINVEQGGTWIAYVSRKKKK